MSTYRYLPSTFAESLRGLNLAMRRPVHGPHEGRHRSPHYGSSVEFAEYREYTPGDPTTLIDWSVYARSDRYVIRRYHEETNVRAFVLLDTSQSLDFRDEGSMTKMACACYLAAGLMYVLVNQGDLVSLMTFDSRVHGRFDPVGTHAGLRPLLQSLEDIRPAGRSDIEAALHQAASMIDTKSFVVLISDLLHDADRITRGIRHLFHDGHNVLVLHVLDKGERRLSFGGVAELRELETGNRLVVEIDEIRAAYEAAADRHVETLRRGCNECLANYHLIDTGMPLGDVFHQLCAG